MKVTNFRRGRIIRVGIVVCLLIPVLYLLANWSESHKKINDVYRASKFGQRLPKEVPVLVEGEITLTGNDKLNILYFLYFTRYG